MKKILSILFVACTLFVSAQSTSPRFGTSSGRDATGRVLTYAVITTTDLAQAPWTRSLSARTHSRPFSVRLQAFRTLFATSSRAPRKRIPSGDICTFIVSKGTGAGKIKFGGSVVIYSTASAAVTLAANKSAIIRFRFNGTKWIEESRMVQP
jgi:hypothetical protein